MFSGGGIDLNLPEGSVGALFFLATTEGAGESMKKSFFGGAFFRFATPTKTFGLF